MSLSIRRKFDCYLAMKKHRTKKYLIHFIINQHLYKKKTKKKQTQDAFRALFLKQNPTPQKEGVRRNDPVININDMTHIKHGTV